MPPPADRPSPSASKPGAVRTSSGQPRVIVVGGGLIGLPLAIATARLGISTLLIDRQPMASKLEAAFDGRTTAIALGAQRILAGWKLWDALAGLAEPILDIRVADEGSRLFVHYDHRELGHEPLGWIVENRHFREILLNAARDLPALTILSPATVAAVRQDRDRATAILADGRTIGAELLVAADGKFSPIRDQVGVTTIGWSYPQQSIVCTVHHARPHYGVAVEHFLPAGPFAILPMREQCSSVVWTEAAEAVPGLLALDEPAFLLELGRRFGRHLGELSLVGPRWSYPLELSMARKMAEGRVAMLGDAAHALHPIAGQGWNLGIRDVAALVELVASRCRLGLDCGDPGTLAAYRRRREPDGIALAATTDGLNRLFSNDLAALAVARRIGLGVVQRTPPLKRFFMRRAMGLDGVPPSARSRPTQAAE